MKKITLAILLLLISLTFIPSEKSTALENSDFESAAEIFADALREGKNSALIESCSIKKSDFNFLMQYAQIENPDVFWFPRSVSYSFSKNGDTITTLNWENIYTDFSQIEDMKAEFDKQVTEAKNFCFQRNMSDFDKILSAHDYITERTSYSFADDYSYTAYSVFVRKEGVCQGYAYAFKLLMDIAGIECYYASSTELNHGWNIVKLDGSFYHVDATKDDPIVEYNNATFKYGCETHEYLLCSEKQFATKATDTKIWCLGDAPVCDNTKYDNAFFRNIMGTAEYINGEWLFIEERKNIDDARQIMKYDDNTVSTLYRLETPIYSIENHRGTLYIASKNKIYSLDEKGQEAEFCSTVGEITGCFSTEGSLHYGVFKKNNYALCSKALDVSTDACEGISVDVNSVEAVLHFHIKPYIELFDGTVTYKYGDEEKTISIESISENGLVSVAFPICEADTEVTLTISLGDVSTSYSASVLEYAQKISEGNYEQGIQSIAKALTDCLSTDNKEYDYTSLSQNQHTLNDNSSTVEYIKTEAEIGQGITLTHHFFVPKDVQFFSDGDAYFEELENGVAVCVSNISPLLFEKQFTVATDNFSIKYSVLDYINACEDENLKRTLYAHYLYGKSLSQYTKINIQGKEQP